MASIRRRAYGSPRGRNWRKAYVDRPGRTRTAISPYRPGARLFRDAECTVTHTYRHNSIVSGAFSAA